MKFHLILDSLQKEDPISCSQTGRQHLAFISQKIMTGLSGTVYSHLPSMRIRPRSFAVTIRETFLT